MQCGAHFNVCAPQELGVEGVVGVCKFAVFHIWHVVWGCGLRDIIILWLLDMYIIRVRVVAIKQRAVSYCPHTNTSILFW